MRLRKAELFRQLGYEPHAVQRALHGSRAKRRVLACGARLGKSTAGAFEAIAALMEPREHCRGWVVAPTYGLAQRIFGQVVDVVHAHLAHRIVADVPREHRLVIRNLAGGLSELCGKTADNPASLLGEELDFLIVDEAARVSDVVWHAHLAARLVDRDGWALALSTPRAASGWFFDLFRRGQVGQDPEVASWRAESAANPYLDPKVIEAERERLPKDVFAREFLAQFEREDEVACDSCGGPSPTAIRIILLDGDQRIPACPACGEAVHEDGTTAVWLGRNGERVVQTVRIHDDWPEETEDIRRRLGGGELAAVEG